MSAYIWQYVDSKYYFHFQVYLHEKLCQNYSNHFED